MLHTITDQEAERIAPRLALFDQRVVLPVEHLNEEPMPALVAYRLVKDDLFDQGRSRMNLATFCQTYMEPEALQIMSETLDCNAIDKSEYPMMAQMENRCVNILADLWHGQAGHAFGCSAVGSSEACQLAGLAMKFLWRNRAKAAGIDTTRTKPNLVISAGYQVCWEKFCVYWDVELRTVPVDETHLSLNTDIVMDYVDEYTIGIVAILGITYTGKFDDIQTLDSLLSAYNKTAKVPLGIHVDAASGGLFCPFVYPDLVWDFALTNVRSISTSGHKYGLVYPGIGWILWRDHEFLPEELIFNVSYLGGHEETMAINFSRSGSHIVGQYYVFARYGRKGLEMVHRKTASVAQFVASELKKLGIFRFYNAGETIPMVALALEKPHIWTIDQLSDRLLMHGWQVPAYPLPANLPDIRVLRLVFRADFSMTMAEQLVRNMKAEIDFLERNGGPFRERAADGANGFTH